MRILGIDPGLQTTGFGVTDAQGHSLAYVASGTITTTHLARGDLPARLKVLFDGIAQVRATYQPDMAAVEIVFVNVNPQATLLPGQARGACITALVVCDLTVAEYTAPQTSGKNVVAVAGYVVAEMLAQDTHKGHAAVGSQRRVSPFGRPLSPSPPAGWVAVPS